jgi:hypothetical protein
VQDEVTMDGLKEAETEVQESDKGLGLVVIYLFSF